jgi:hypothetical protein
MAPHASLATVCMGVHVSCATVVLASVMIAAVRPDLNSDLGTDRARRNNAAASFFGMLVTCLIVLALGIVFVKIGSVFLNCVVTVLEGSDASPRDNKPTTAERQPTFARQWGTENHTLVVHPAASMHRPLSSRSEL